MFILNGFSLNNNGHTVSQFSQVFKSLEDALIKKNQILELFPNFEITDNENNILVSNFRKG